MISPRAKVHKPASASKGVARTIPVNIVIAIASTLAFIHAPASRTKLQAARVVFRTKSATNGVSWSLDELPVSCLAVRSARLRAARSLSAK